MWRIIAGKEIRTNLTNGRALAILSVSCAAFVATGTAGVKDYAVRHADHLARTQQQEQSLTRYRTMMTLEQLGLYLSAPPEPLSVFVTGVERGFGRAVKVQRLWYPQYTGPAQESPLVEATGTVDFAFVILIVMTLATLLVSCDTFTAERQAGTFRLLLAHASRRDLMLGKWLGAAAGAIVPCALGFLAGASVVGFQLARGFTLEDWLRIFALLACAVVFLSMFVSIGMAVSAQSDTTTQSLSVSLALWLVLVLVAARTAAPAAMWLAPAPSAESVEASVERQRQVSRRDSYSYLHHLAEGQKAALKFETIFFATQEYAAKAAAAIHRLRETEESEQLHSDRVVDIVVSATPTGAFLSAAARLMRTSVADKREYLDRVKEYRTEVLNRLERLPDPQAAPFDRRMLPPAPEQNAQFGASREIIQLMLVLGVWAAAALLWAVATVYRLTP